MPVETRPLSAAFYHRVLQKVAGPRGPRHSGQETVCRSLGAFGRFGQPPARAGPSRPIEQKPLLSILNRQGDASKATLFCPNCPGNGRRFGSRLLMACWQASPAVGRSLTQPGGGPSAIGRPSQDIPCSHARLVAESPSLINTCHMFADIGIIHDEGIGAASAASELAA